MAVNKDAGAGFGLTVNGSVVIDNWTRPATNPVKLAGTNIAYDVRLEYAHFSDGAQVTLSWLPPGASGKEVIPPERFQRSSSAASGVWGATGVSVDANGKIWAGCWDGDAAVRIDPNAGPLVVTTDVIHGTNITVTNHLGLVDMVVDLGDGTWHPMPYNVPAHPYNYSDMTGFNERVVNPSFQPFKGYWMVINDSGNAGQLWNKVSWSATNATPADGCSIEVYVRAADERTDLGNATFVQATNNVFFLSIRGRFIEVRLSMTRDDPSRQPMLYDLTLYGVSSGFAGDNFLYGASANEGGGGTFWTDLVGAEPVGYRWFRQYPWETNETEVLGATNSYFVMTNVDSWVAGTEVSCMVTNGDGEVLWLGPAYLNVDSVQVDIPATKYLSYQGPATRYPMTINVFGQPTNFNNVSVTVTLWGLTHSRSADISVLVVSPSGKGIMLMSNVGGTNGVSYADLSFNEAFSAPSQAGPLLPPGQYYVAYQPSNYGQVSQMPEVGSDPPPATYSANLSDLKYDNPNGLWKLYIYDMYQGMKGRLTDSWQLGFTFQ